MTSSGVQAEKRSRSFIVALVLAACLAAGAVFVIASSSTSEGTGFCPADARLNADGTMSGRDPANNCEFPTID